MEVPGLVFRGERTGGAFVISLDFELAWGVRDIYGPRDPYMLRVIHERRAVPRILDLFEKYDVSATWAVVGMMFARTRWELEHFSPRVKPRYKDPTLDPYREDLGEGEEDDPLHYGYRLIRHISQANRQEIATHTFSHYYCLEEGQTREAFAADLDSALALAEKHGIRIRSIVFPRNQHNPDYDGILLEKGIICFRGTEKHPMYRGEMRKESRKPHKRLFRLADSHLSLSGPHLTAWEEVVEGSGLCNVAASRYLRPPGGGGVFSGFRLKRILRAMEEAGKTQRIFHLWTHPQDLGMDLEENLQGLTAILEHFKRLEKQYGMASLTMIEAGDRALEIKDRRGKAWI